MSSANKWQSSSASAASPAASRSGERTTHDGRGRSSGRPLTARGALSELTISTSTVPEFFGRQNRASATRCHPCLFVLRWMAGSWLPGNDPYALARVGAAGIGPADNDGLGGQNRASATRCHPCLFVLRGWLAAGYRGNDPYALARVGAAGIGPADNDGLGGQKTAPQQRAAIPVFSFCGGWLAAGYRGNDPYALARVGAAGIGPADNDGLGGQKKTAPQQRAAIPVFSFCGGWLAAGYRGNDPTRSRAKGGRDWAGR